jgi:hypothetical protein
MTAFQDTKCEQTWYKPFSAQDSKIFAGRVEVCAVRRIVCVVPIWDSRAAQPSAEDAARQINNKTPCVIKTRLAKNATRFSA